MKPLSCLQLLSLLIMLLSYENKLENRNKTDKMASNYALRTRSGAEDPIFGCYLEQLPCNKLPIKSEIYRNFLFRKESNFERLYQRDNKIIKSLDSTTKNTIIHELVANLKDIWWNRASIPVRDDTNLFVDVKNLITEGSELSKNVSRARSVGKAEYLKTKGFDKILDISKCR